MSRLWILPVLGLIAFLGFACGDDVPASAGSATPASAVPADWLTYTHPTAGFSFRYPPNWSLQEYASGSAARVASFDLSTWNGPRYPAGGILIDFGRTSQTGARPSDAADANLGTVSGWTRRPPNAGEGPGAKSVIYSAKKGEYTYSLAAAFDLADADESIVQMIASTFAVSN